MPSRGSPPRRQRACEVILALFAMVACWARPLPAEAAPPKPRPPARTPAPPPARTPAAPAPAPVAPVPAAAAPTAPAAAPAAVESSIDPNDVTWRQIMMAPAISGNLRTLAVDPSDEKSIFVATQEGTLAHSIDGGITWSEIEVSPFMAQSPTIGFSPVGDDYKQIDVFAGFKVRIGPDYHGYNPLGRRSAGQGLPTAAPPRYRPEVFWAPPQWVGAMRYAGVSEPLLGAVADKDPQPYDDIRFVTVCPGGANSVFVITTTKLLGSSDGTRFVELFSGRDSAPLERVLCSPTDPNDVILTSGDGTYRSLDGGFSFEPIGVAASTVIAFGPPRDGGATTLFLVAGGELWVGDPNEPDAMRAVPVGGDGEIRHIAATSQSVWLATDGGVRVSRDGGNTWAPVDDLEGFPWERVVVATAGGREHVLVLREDIAFLSTDGGLTFSPSFRAESRRRLRRVAALPSPAGASPGFLLLTSGEVWTTRAQDRTEDPKLEEVRRAAARRIKQMPPLNALLERAAVKTRLSDAQVDDLAERSSLRAWLPGVVTNFGLGSLSAASRSTVTVSTPTNTSVADSKTLWYGTIDLVWELPDLVAPAHPFSPTRASLYEIRKRLSYFVEDAYMERRQVLSQLAGGGIDVEEALTLQARVEVLDAVLEEFTTDTGER